MDVEVGHGKLLRIGELAKRSGKSVRALHLYEELGLLRPEHRSQGGFRLYHHSSVERVQWITKLQEAGFSLNELRELLHDIGVERVAPEAMKREIWRNYPVLEKVELVESLLDRGVVADGQRVSKQPGRCCPTGCEPPALIAAK